MEISREDNAPPFSELVLNRLIESGTLFRPLYVVVFEFSLVEVVGEVESGMTKIVFEGFGRG